MSIVECDSNNNCSELCSRVNDKDVCQCPVGYSLNDDGLNCDDIDECTRGDHICEEENMVKKFIYFFEDSCFQYMFNYNSAFCTSSFL